MTLWLHLTCFDVFVQVESPLHRQQLLRAMQRQILGLGSPPGPLQRLQCSVSTTTSTSTSSQAHADPDATPAPDNPASSAHQSAHPNTAAETPGTQATAAAAVPAAVVCSWLPPADPGQPGMHKYVLQRMDHSAPSAVWQTVAELHDSLSVRHRDAPPKPGVYQYRLAVSTCVTKRPDVCACPAHGASVGNPHWVSGNCCCGLLVHCLGGWRVCGCGSAMPVGYCAAGLASGPSRQRYYCFC